MDVENGDMVTFRLGNAAVADVRFGVSPLVETTLSLRVLASPERFPLQVPWERRARERLGEVDTATLMAVLNEHGHTPDVLTPPPTAVFPSADAEFDALRDVDPELLAADIADVTGRPTTLGRGRRLVDRVVDALEGYWHACVGPHWPRMRTVMEADVTHRGLVVARRGLPAALGSLSPTVTLERDGLVVASRHGFDHEVDVGARPLWLLPTMFSARAAYPGRPDHPPMVMYPARGQGDMWTPAPDVDPDAVTDLLGRPRTRLLRMLAEPLSTRTLAGRLGLTPSAVNQHLQVMKRSGLLTAHRSGRSVLYARTALGDTLAG